MNNFRIKLKSIMNKRGVTVEKMARDLDVSNATIFNWRLGKGLKPKNITRICKYLNCTPTEIIEIK